MCASANMTVLGRYLVVFCLPLFFGSSVSAQEWEINRWPHQPGKMFRTITKPDGSIEREHVPMSEEARRAMLRQQLFAGAGPMMRVLDRLEVEDIEQLASSELTKDQREQLQGLLTDYRFKRGRLEKTDEQGAISLRTEYGMKVNDVLLPNQLDAIRISGSVFHNLLAGPIADLIAIEAGQRSRLTQDCEKLNAEVSELITEIERKTAELQKKAEQVLSQSLTMTQRQKLERIMGRQVDGYFDRSDLLNLDSQTRMKIDRE